MARIGPTFDYVTARLKEGEPVFEVWANGVAPMHQLEGEHTGVYVGWCWSQGSLGWVACPRRTDSQTDTWQDMVDRSIRHFRNQREASVFLWGYDRGIRQPLTAKFARMILQSRVPTRKRKSFLGDGSVIDLDGKLIEKEE